MYSSIVVGTDGSATANAAVLHAARLASTCGGAKLHLVTAYRPVDALGLAPEAMASVSNLDPHADAAHIAQEAADKARAEGVEVEVYVAPGDPASALIDVAENVGADVVVVGSRGMTGAKRFLLGSVPNRVAHHAPCTVLIVRTAK